VKKKRKEKAVAAAPDQGSPFDCIENGETSKAEFHQGEESLRVELLQAQEALREADFPVLVLLSGVDAAGKGETANLLAEWMDPRGLVTQAYGPPSTEESERPEFWRYWRDLPARGRIGIFLSAWYHPVLVDRVYGKIDEAEQEAQLERIRAFERTLADDGALILKFWVHLGKADQKKRLRALEGDPLLAWRVTETDWRHWRMYDRFIAASERIIRRTDTEATPWTILDGRDRGWRSLRIGQALRDGINAHVARRKRAAEDAQPPPRARSSPVHRPCLAALDLDRETVKKDYRRELKELQGRLNLLYRYALEEGKSTVLVFEGWDAGGKGGAIRRVITALDARGYRVVQIAAPTDEELAHHYLWRFWRHVPRAGAVTIFDRSWYGRVLVERVEGFASEAEWGRAYREINEFECQLVDEGIVLVKFWLHISRDEQERRFQRRLQIPYKNWKLNDEDWRNRQRWQDYEDAVEEMVARTSEAAPWTLVEGNAKRYARLKVLRTICRALEDALGESLPA
jgi:polyphosphate:AMP phosphotransferase